MLRPARSPKEAYKETLDFLREERRLIVLFSLSYLLSYWLANFALYRYVITDPVTLLPLRDLGFDIIPESSAKSLHIISDWIPIVCVFASIVSMNVWGTRALFVDMIRRGTVVFLLNNICQTLTVVPHAETVDCFILRIDSDGDMSDHNHIGWWILWEPNIFSNCSDMMWSGHTAHTLQAFHALYAVFWPYPWLVPIFAVIYTTLVVCMISIRYHYTMDIFVATTIVFFAFRDVRPLKYRPSHGDGYVLVTTPRVEQEAPPIASMKDARKARKTATKVVVRL